MDLGEVGRRIRMLREEKGFSLRDLEGKTGISRSMLSLYERGVSRFSAKNLEKIAEALGVTPEDLTEEWVSEETLKNLSRNFKAQLLKKASELSPRGRKKLLEYLTFILFQEEEERKRKERS
jgi:transcriptional regulator with XRE-family HTH domain